VAGVAVDCACVGGYRGRCASVAGVRLGFLRRAGYDAAVVVLRMRDWGHEAIVTAVRRIVRHKAGLWVWVVLEVGFGGAGSLLALIGRQIAS